MERLNVVPGTWDLLVVAADYGSEGGLVEAGDIEGVGEVEYHSGLGSSSCSIL